MGGVRVLLVHGMWQGAWVWEPVRRLLDAAGVSTAAPQLPLTDFTHDVAVVRAALGDAGEPVLLVGHSYGGAVISTAGQHPAVRRLLYIAAFPLTEGECVSRALPEHDFPPTGLGAALRFGDDAEVTVDPAQARDLLYHHAPAAVASSAIDRHRPVPRSLFSAPAGPAAWRTRTTGYAVCTDDRAVSPDLQRALGARAGAAVTQWWSDHTPQLSHPDLVAALVQAAAAAP